MASATYDEAEWIQALLDEAGRDLVFVFNIADGMFGGPSPMPTQDQFLDLLKRISAALIEGGCVVGFGDPTEGNWEEVERLRVPREQVPHAIAVFYSDSPDEACFLTFTHRESQ